MFNKRSQNAMHLGNWEHTYYVYFGIIAVCTISSWQWCHFMDMLSKLTQNLVLLDYTHKAQKMCQNNNHKNALRSLLTWNHTNCLFFPIILQQGVLIGPSITIVYTIVGIPIARFTDNNSRVIPLALGLLVWTGMVCLTAFAETYWMLLLAQVIIGIGEVSFINCLL